MYSTVFKTDMRQVLSWVGSTPTCSRQKVVIFMNKLLRSIPNLDKMLKTASVCQMIEQYGYDAVLQTLREETDNLRQQIINGQTVCVDQDILLQKTQNNLSSAFESSLRPVINATGIILHTNLGRANLSREAVRAVNNIISSYSTLEYNLDIGERGSRHEHIEKSLCKLFNVEAAMVVNNNAAATMLTLSEVAAGKSVVVSRGEMVEIGGSFRIPDIMSASSAILKEVGTTNKTYLPDYENSFQNDEIAALLKVHTSNYKIIGFVQSVAAKELAVLANKYEVPLIYDLGSGLAVSLDEYGIDEQTVKDAVAAGSDLILFSGDKLLGGPQCGIILGRKKWIEAMKCHPLARVMRVDKMTLAALQATLQSYLKGTAFQDIPVLQMINKSETELWQQADDFRQNLNSQTDSYELATVSVHDKLGGGTAPQSILAGAAVALTPRFCSAGALSAELHRQELPIISRIQNNQVLLHMRTILPEQEDSVIKSLVRLGIEVI